MQENDEMSTILTLVGTICIPKGVGYVPERSFGAACGEKECSGEALGAKKSISWWVFEGFRTTRRVALGHPGEAHGAKMPILWWVFACFCTTRGSDVRKPYTSDDFAPEKRRVHGARTRVATRQNAHFEQKCAFCRGETRFCKNVISGYPFNPDRRSVQ